MRRRRLLTLSAAVAAMFAAHGLTGARAQAPAPPAADCPASAGLPRGHEIVIELLAASTHVSRQGRVDWARLQSDSGPRLSQIRWEQQRTTFHFESDNPHLPYRVTAVILSPSGAPPSTSILDLSYSEPVASLAPKVETSDTTYSFEQRSDRAPFRAEVRATILGRETAEIGDCRYDGVRRASTIRDLSNGDESSSIRIQIPSLDITFPIEEISRAAGRPPIVTRYVPLAIRVRPAAK